MWAKPCKVQNAPKSWVQSSHLFELRAHFVTIVLRFVICHLNSGLVRSSSISRLLQCMRALWVWQLTTSLTSSSPKSADTHVIMNRISS